MVPVTSSGPPTTAAGSRIQAGTGSGRRRFPDRARTTRSRPARKPRAAAIRIATMDPDRPQRSGWSPRTTRPSGSGRHSSLACRPHCPPCRPDTATTRHVPGRVPCRVPARIRRPAFVVRSPSRPRRRRRGSARPRGEPPRTAGVAPRQGPHRPSMARPRRDQPRALPVRWTAGATWRRAVGSGGAWRRCRAWTRIGPPPDGQVDASRRRVASRWSMSASVVR